LATAQSGVGSLAAIGRLKELRERFWFTLGALLVFRLGSFIPVPGVDPGAMLSLMERQAGTVVDLLNMFSGGALGRFSLFALGVMPYISASIVVQLLSYALPAFIALRKEGESGRRTLNQYTRYGTLGLAVVQSFGIATALLSSQMDGGMAVVTTSAWTFMFSAVVGLSAGTLFLMWLGEQITERGLGNGISLLIFAGIVAGLPGAIAGTVNMAQSGQLEPLVVIFILALVVAVTAFCVFMERAQRRITINYARRMAGGRAPAYMNNSQWLPLKLNMAGVIPAIFASSLLMFPATVATWFGENPDLRWLSRVAAYLNYGQPLYLILEAGLIMFFAFFYTAMVFNSQETAENLKKSGALIPGIRPGKATADYIDAVLTRLTLVGGAYLVAVCLLPALLTNAYGVPFHFGGTSLLIVVVVVMDFMSQVQAHMVSHQYESVLKKANFKGLSKS